MNVFSCILSYMELSFIFAYGMLSNVSKTGNVFTVYFLPSNFLVNDKCFHEYSTVDFFLYIHFFTDSLCFFAAFSVHVRCFISVFEILLKMFVVVLDSNFEENVI